MPGTSSIGTYHMRSFVPEYTDFSYIGYKIIWSIVNLIILRTYKYLHKGRPVSKKKINKKENSHLAVTLTFTKFKLINIHAFLKSNERKETTRLGLVGFFT